MTVVAYIAGVFTGVIIFPAGRFAIVAAAVWAWSRVKK